jgi:RNA polymerase sigma-70 factor, ECF subfamily
VNPPAAPDQAYVAAALQGERQAFGVLVSRYHQPIYLMLARMFRDAHLADDAAQEAFVKAWQKLHTYQPERPFGAWIRSIAVRTALDLLRKEKPMAALDTTTLVVTSPGPESQVEAAQAGEAVRQAVLALPPAARAVLVLREYEGLSYQEIATDLHIPVGTVMSRLNYARNQLRKALLEVQDG